MQDQSTPIGAIVKGVIAALPPHDSHEDFSDSRSHVHEEEVQDGAVRAAWAQARQYLHADDWHDLVAGGWTQRWQPPRPVSSGSWALFYLCTLVLAKHRRRPRGRLSVAQLSDRMQPALDAICRQLMVVEGAQYRWRIDAGYRAQLERLSSEGQWVPAGPRAR